MFGIMFHHTYAVIANAGITVSVLKDYDCILLNKWNFKSNTLLSN